MKIVLGWVKENEQKILESPRKKFFDEETSDFLIDKITSESIQLRFMPSGTPLNLKTWRFEEALAFLKERNAVTRIGARLKTKKNASPSFSVEEHLNGIAMNKYQRKSDTKTAPHVCDLLVLAGIAEYQWTNNEDGKKVQGIRLRPSNTTES